MAKFKKSSPFIGPFFTVIFGSLTGVAIAVVLLVIQQVNVVDAATQKKAEAVSIETDAKPKKNPAQIVPIVSVVRGRVPHTPSSMSTARQRAFLDRNPAGVELIEEDLNRWINATWDETKITFPSDPKREFYKARAPRVRVDGNALEILEEVEIGNPKKSDFSYRACAFWRGTIRVVDGKATLVTEKAYLNSLPVPVEFFWQAFQQAGLVFSIPEDALASWTGIKDAKIEEGRVKFSFN